MQLPSSQRISLLRSHSLLRADADVQRESDGSERIYKHIQGDSRRRKRGKIERAEIKFKSVLIVKCNALVFHKCNYKNATENATKTKKEVIPQAESHKQCNENALV